jgi:hypothetical protein
MPSKPIELPPAVAKAFVKDMRAFLAEENAIKRDEIAARQLHLLREYNPPRAKKLRLSDVHQCDRKLAVKPPRQARRRVTARFSIEMRSRSAGWAIGDSTKSPGIGRGFEVHRAERDDQYLARTGPPK